MLHFILFALFSISSLHEIFAGLRIMINWQQKRFRSAFQLRRRFTLIVLQIFCLNFVFPSIQRSVFLRALFFLLSSDHCHWRFYAVLFIPHRHNTLVNKVKWRMLQWILFFIICLRFATLNSNVSAWFEKAVHYDKKFRKRKLRNCS